MRFVAILFLFVAFGLVKGLILAEAESEPIAFPALNPRQIGDCDTTPENETAVNATGCIRTFELEGCGGIVSCTKFIGLAIYNIGAYIIWIVLFIVDLVVFLVLMIALLSSLLFAPIPGVPGWIELTLNAILPALLAMKIYTLIREGRDQ